MHDICNYDEYFVQKRNCAGNLGLLPQQKFTAVIRMLAYGSSADQVDEIARMGKSTILERQERETRERMRRRAASKRAQRELDEQLGIAVA